MTPLQTAAQNLLQIFHRTGNPIDAPMRELRKALEAEQAQAVEPHGWMINGMSEVMSRGHAKAVQTEHQAMGGTAVAYPVYLHPASERAELIAELKGSADLLQIGKVEDWDDLAAEILQAADMLEADAQEIESLECDYTDQVMRAMAAEKKLTQQVAVPKVTVELPDGDERTVKTWFTEMRNGELVVSISVEAQQVAVPMTDTQIYAVARNHPRIGTLVPHIEVRQFARAIEAHHGIGAKIAHNPDWSAA